MECKGKNKRKPKAHHLSRGSVQVFQDIFHLFEKSDNVTLNGKELSAAMKEHGINLADSEIDSTLSILNNHDDTMDIYEFCYLVASAMKHLLAIRDDIKSDKPLLAALKQFLLISALSCVGKREVWTRKSADTLGFYFQGARLAGLTEKQVAIRACSIDTSGNSPYKQPIVLPGLPPGDGSKGSSRVAAQAPCTILPPPPSEVGGRKLSKCTILPYDGGLGSMVEVPRRRIVSLSTVKESKPVVMKKRDTLPYASPLALQSKDQKDGEKPPPRGRPLPFKLPGLPEHHGRMIPFEEMTKIRDEIFLAQRDHHLRMKEFAARKLVNSIPSEQFRKQFKHTIKAYFG